ncbi:MAG: rod-binding protein [Acetobacteraceae bacterium]|nr:rod-binding protein [Acetobacteraceae bacterium]
MAVGDRVGLRGGTPGPGVAAEDAVRRALGDQTALASRVRQAVDAGDRAAVAEACQEFESLFLYQLLRQMWATVPEGALDSGFAQDTYRQMYHMELARLMARAGGIGLGRMLLEQLLPQEDSRPRG